MMISIGKSGGVYRDSEISWAMIAEYTPRILSIGMIGGTEHSWEFDSEFEASECLRRVWAAMNKTPNCTT